MGIEDVLADDPDIADLLPGELFEIFLIGFGGAHFGFLVARGYGDCLVKQAVADGEISRIRYEDYVMIYNDLKEKRKW